MPVDMYLTIQLLQFWMGVIEDLVEHMVLAPQKEFAEEEEDEGFKLIDKIDSPRGEANAESPTVDASLPLPGFMLGFSTELRTSTGLASVPKILPFASRAEQAIEACPSLADPLPSYPLTNALPSPQKGGASDLQVDAAPPPLNSPARSNVSSVLALTSVELNAAVGIGEKIDNIID